MIRVGLLLCFSFLAILSTAQSDTYLGAGNSDNIIVTTSSDQTRSGWTRMASGDKTISGDGLEGMLMEAGRLLSQAAIGYDLEDIEKAADLGIEAWIDDQINMPSTLYEDRVTDIYNELYALFIASGGYPEDFRSHPSWREFMYAWFDVNMQNDDLLRHRVALALSEILVVSWESELANYGWGLSDYMDIFIEHAFGNYQDILMDVTLHPMMGFYLSHLNNPRSNPDENVHPDENYARELMQLFTIGLYELNIDGSRKLDNDGKFIPTYGQSQITNFAKVFTGLGLGAVRPNNYFTDPDFGYDIYFSDNRVPMKMYEDWHEPGPKVLLNGTTIPNGLGGMTDIQLAVENLFNHDNVGPFICRQLIQRLVKSNPTGDYVARVAVAFNDNGQGKRGDMGAVVRAILMDEEARTCAWMNGPTQGKLREPIMKYAHFAKGIGMDSPSGKFWNIAYGFHDDTKQAPLGAASVFNFFLPDFQPIGEIASAGLVAPEFQIFDTRTSIGYVNNVYAWTQWEYLFDNWEDDDGYFQVYTDFGSWVEYARDPEALVNRLDLVMTNGQLSNETREIIKDAISQQVGGLSGLFDRAILAAYLVAISPDYNISK